MKKYALPLALVLLSSAAIADPVVTAGLTPADPDLFLNNNNTQNSISGDGLTLFGEDTVNGFLPAFWSANGGLTDIALPNGFNFVSGYVTAATPDAGILAGRMTDTSGLGGHAFSYQNGTVTILPSVAGAGAPDDQAFGISSDASTIVGYSRLSNNAIYGVKWVNGAAPIILDSPTGLGNGLTIAKAVSGDGNTIVGVNNGDALAWFNGGTSYTVLAGSFAQQEADAVSRDGSTIAGTVFLGGIQTEAVKWTDHGTVQTVIGIFGNNDNSIPTGVSADGRIIVGSSINEHFGFGPELAWRYTDATGMQSLNDLLTNAGVNMSGISFTSANGISDDGNYIAAVANETNPYIVLYDDGIAAATTLPSAQKSIVQLSDDLSNSLAENSATAANLLGATRPITSDTYAYTGAMIGSAEGYFGGQYSKNNFTILGGVAYGHQDYHNVEQSDTTTLALAGRYTFQPVAKGLRPYTELGAWGTPDESLTLHRNYANGAGGAIGTGNSGAYSYAGYGRLGLAYDLTPKDKISTFAELGQESLHHDGYTEAFSSANPFPAQVSGGLLRYDVARLGASVTHTLTTGKYPLTATVSGAVAQAFNAQGNLRANIAGIGAMQAATSTPTWGEFGASLGVALTNRLSANLGILGTSGDSNMGTALHGTAGVTYKF